MPARSLIQVRLVQAEELVVAGADLVVVAVVAAVLMVVVTVD